MSEEKIPQLGCVVNRRQICKAFGSDPVVEQINEQVERGRALFHGFGEEKRRTRFPEVEKTFAEIAAELETRRPGSILRTCLGLVYDFTGEPSLLEMWHAAHDRAQRLVDATKPPLPVKAGDWVKIDGHPAKVTSTDLRTRVAFIVTGHKDGREGAGDSCKADPLVPVPPNDPTAIPWPEPPDTMTDGYARARFHMRTLANAIERAGLETDPFIREE